jgi:hypothetical protein
MDDDSGVAGHGFSGGYGDSGRRDVSKRNSKSLSVEPELGRCEGCHFFFVWSNSDKRFNGFPLPFQRRLYFNDIHYTYFHTNGFHFNSVRHSGFHCDGFRYLGIRDQECRAYEFREELVGWWDCVGCRCVGIVKRRSSDTPGLLVEALGRLEFGVSEKGLEASGRPC